jgi:hypothetical protein
MGLSLLLLLLLLLLVLLLPRRISAMLAPSRASPEGSPTPASWAKVGSRSMCEAATWETPLEKTREKGVKRRPVTHSWAHLWSMDVIFIYKL